MEYGTKLFLRNKLAEEINTAYINTGSTEYVEKLKGALESLEQEIARQNRRASMSIINHNDATKPRRLH